MFQGGCISWNSKKQQTTALSTTEAEYMPLAVAGQEALWLLSLFQELGKPPVRSDVIMKVLFT